MILEKTFHVRTGRKSRKEVCDGEPALVVEVGRVPRVAKLMALAIRFDGFVREGVVRDYAELARLGHVTRARMSQIMNMLNLAPDIQEAILMLPRVARGKDLISERGLRRVVAEVDWRVQRRMWQGLTGGIQQREN